MEVAVKEEVVIVVMARASAPHQVLLGLVPLATAGTHLQLLRLCLLLLPVPMAATPMVLRGCQHLAAHQLVLLLGLAQALVPTAVLQLGCVLQFDCVLQVPHEEGVVAQWQVGQAYVVQELWQGWL